MVSGLLFAGASLDAEPHALGLKGSCGTRDQLLHGTWDPPGAGIKLMSPGLAGGFLTTGPPGKSPEFLDFLCDTLSSCKAGLLPIFSLWGTVSLHILPTCILESNCCVPFFCHFI